MSQERVRCPRGLCAVSIPCGEHLGLPRDEAKRRGLARGSAGYELMQTARITERVAVRTSLEHSFATVEPLSQTSVLHIKKKRGESRLLSRIYLAFSLQDKTRLISLAVKRSERRLGAREIWPY